MRGSVTANQRVALYLHDYYDSAVNIVIDVSWRASDKKKRE